MRKQWVAAAAVAVLSAGPAVAGELKFSAKVFADVTYRQNVDQGTNVTSTDSGTGVDVKRFYLGAEYRYNDVFSAKLITDIGDKGAKRFDVFVKNAYIEAKLHPLFTVRLGEAGNPWIPFVEDHYGFRYVEPTFTDRTSFGFSTDWGVHVLGGTKLFNYQLSVVNGRGFGDPTRSKNPTGEARVGFTPIEGLTLGLGGLYGKLGQQVEGTKTPETARRGDAVASYETKLFRVGVEGFAGRNDTANMVLGKTPSDLSRGFSVWGNVNLHENCAVFARYDYLQPLKNANPDLTNDYFNVGLQYKPVDVLSLALVYKRETTQSGSLAKGASLSTSNGTIGSTVPNQTGRFQEFGLFAQYVY
jgi:hypothetical protein